MKPADRAAADATAPTTPIGDQVGGGPIGPEVGQSIPADVPINGAVPSDEDVALEMGLEADPNAATTDGENAP